MSQHKEAAKLIDALVNTEPCSSKRARKASVVDSSSPEIKRQSKAEELEQNEREAEANAVDAVLGEKAMWYWQNASGQVLPVEVGNTELTAHWQVQKDPKVSHMHAFDLA